MKESERRESQDWTPWEHWHSYIQVFLLTTAEVKLEEGSGVEALCCFSLGLPCDAGGSWNTLAQGKGLEGKPEFRKGEAAVPYPALETKLPLTPPPYY